MAISISKTKMNYQFSFEILLIKESCNLIGQEWVFWSVTLKDKFCTMTSSTEQQHVIKFHEIGIKRGWNFIEKVFLTQCCSLRIKPWHPFHKQPPEVLCKKRYYKLGTTDDNSLTQLLPMHPFYTHWKCQKISRFSDVFRG